MASMVADGLRQGKDFLGPGLPERKDRMTADSFNAVEIDLAALRENYANIQAVAGAGVRVMAVVKADAYGHGMVAAARSLWEAGARTFGVAEIEEGIALRQAGVGGEIVILLGILPAAAPEIVRHDLTPVLFDLETVAELSRRAVAAQKEVDVHLKVDVGMGRLGIAPEQAVVFASAIAGLPGLRLAGLLSHLPMADQPEAAAATAGQLALFNRVLAQVAALAPADRFVHIANSAGLLYHPASRFNMVRAGISLYGCYPDGAAVPVAGRPVLRPVMRFVSRVLQVKELPAGAGISYGHTFVTSRPTRLAVLPVGYDDGYLRRLSNRAVVLIRGQRMPICGRVCMNACMADITDLPDAATVKPGDEVVLMGCQGDEEIDADQVAAWLETISYEVLCLFGNRNRRIYRN